MSLAKLSILSTGGRIVTLPDWAVYLLELGIAESDVLRNNPPLETRTIALCLPRLEYGAVLLGCGVVLGAAGCSLDKKVSVREQINKLIGSDVSVICRDQDTQKQKTIVGRVDGIRAGSTPDMDRLALLVKAKQSHGRVCESLDLYLIKRIDSLLPAVGRVNLGRRQSKKQLLRQEGFHKEHKNISSCFGDEVAAWLSTKQRNTTLTIIGAKQRLCDEDALSIIDQDTAGELFALSDILRTNCNGRRSSIVHTIVESNRQALGTSRLVIIEASPQLPDMLREITNCTRFILLDRSCAKYDEMTNSVLACHRTRRRGVSISKPPINIEALAFIS